MIEAFGGRKFLAWVVQEVILLLIFAGLLFTGRLTDGIFVAWLGAQALNFGIYGTTNALSKKYQIPAQGITASTGLSIPSVLGTSTTNGGVTVSSIPETHIG